MRTRPSPRTPPWTWPWLSWRRTSSSPPPSSPSACPGKKMGLLKLLLLSFINIDKFHFLYISIFLLTLLPAPEFQFSYLHCCQPRRGGELPGRQRHGGGLGPARQLYPGLAEDHQPRGAPGLAQHDQRPEMGIQDDQKR